MIGMEDEPTVHICEIDGHQIKTVTTYVADYYETGYTIIDGLPAYDWEYDVEKQVRRTRGYESGSIWSEWQ